MYPSASDKWVYGMIMHLLEKIAELESRIPKGA